MSNTLIKITLCDDSADYEQLLASLNIAKGLLDCDDLGFVANNVGFEIIEKLFEHGDSDNNALWYSVSGKAADDTTILKVDGEEFSDDDFTENDTEEDLVTPYTCFGDTGIRFYAKNCTIDSCIWKPELDECDEDILDIFEISKLNPFATLMGNIAQTLVEFENKESDDTFENMILLLETACKIIRQRVALTRSLNKSLLTIDKCDL